MIRIESILENDYLLTLARHFFVKCATIEDRDNLRLSDIADITMGQSPPGESYNTSFNGVLFFQGCAEFGRLFPTPNLFTTQPKRFAEQGDVLISVRAPVGDVNIALERCAIGRGLATVRMKNGCQAYLHYLLDSSHQMFESYNGTGTVFGSITKSDLNNLKLDVLKPESMFICNSKLAPIDFQIKSIHNETMILTKLRQTLIGTLMA